jgi:hypothetical protein
MSGDIFRASFKKRLFYWLANILWQVSKVLAKWSYGLDEAADDL